LKPLEECIVLHVEDDDASAYLFQHALAEAKLNPRLYRVTNGEDASAFLAKCEPYTDPPLPDLVLLDLNLPRKSGLEVLVDAKREPVLATVRFVILSTSAEDGDRERAIAAGADEYLVKGGDIDAFVDAAKAACGVITKQTFA
jgi:chemotaxis family two-component system response regulator Rcp1